MSFFVYLLQSLSFSEQTYVGYTTDIENRLKYHNNGLSPHTSKYRPWKIHTYISFDSKEKALDFERFLKTGSGREFARRRLW